MHSFTHRRAISPCGWYSADVIIKPRPALDLTWQFSIVIINRKYIQYPFKLYLT